jgi:hypothetical protein
MLFMVIETYKHGAQSVYARAAERGRMLPPGLVYLDSWVDERRLDRCFQLMETENSALFDDWLRCVDAVKVDYFLRDLERNVWLHVCVEPRVVLLLRLPHLGNDKALASSYVTWTRKPG